MLNINLTLDESQTHKLTNKETYLVSGNVKSPIDYELIYTDVKRKGLNKNSRDDVIKLIDSSKIVCSNCYIKLENDIIELI